LTPAIEESLATDAKIDIPLPTGLAYLGYQKAGIAFMAKKPAILMADDMGLGKTPQAIGVFNHEAWIETVLVICPGSLKVNWEREFRRWASRPLDIAIADGFTPRYGRSPQGTGSFAGEPWEIPLRWNNRFRS
jgi:SWI/SNF-related matrix-associated actin-dependent regulator 1 of chromatin subfamily A